MPRKPSTPRHNQTCAICGNTFYAAPAHKRTCCSRACKSIHLSRGIEQTCEVCGLAFKRLASRAYAHTYCSDACRIVGSRKRVTLMCRHCGKPFEWIVSRAHVRKFCSLVCHRAHDIAHGRTDGKPATIRWVDGYVMVPNPHGPGRVLEHRLVAEYMIGRPLLPGEVVHHIDECRTNNDPSNLQVMTRSDHSSLHRKRAAG